MYSLEALGRIVEHEEHARNIATERMDVEPALSEVELDEFISHFESQIQQHRSVLAKMQHDLGVGDLSAISTPSQDPKERLKQLQAMSQAYDDINTSIPDLPDPNSPVPILFAMDDVKRSIKDSKMSIEASVNHLASTEHQLESEEARLADANALASAINSRIVHLQDSQEHRTSKPHEEIADQILHNKMESRKLFNSKTKALHQSLINFIGRHLGAMVAAEELGGPVVGEMGDIDVDVLTSGFSSQGKPRNVKSGLKGLHDSKRQARIDEIWGVDSAGQTSEQAAACSEVGELIDDLIAALYGASDSGVYVVLSRDSAASRFLVRAKIAQYHPKDARRLRLVDFGRGVDD